MSLSHWQRLPLGLSLRLNDASDASLSAGKNKNLICALPKHVLTRILELASSTPDSLHPQTYGESRMISKHSTLDSLRLVCRSWNWVILDSSWLYGTILAAGNADDLRFAKSNGAPLFVYPKIPQEEHSRPVMYCDNSAGTALHRKRVRSVLRELYRTRFLCLSLATSEYNSSWVIKAFSSTKAPNIRALHLQLTIRKYTVKGTTDEPVDNSASDVTMERMDVSTGSLLPSTLFGGDGRALKELVLRGVGIRWTDLMTLGNLTTLALHNQCRIKTFKHLAEIFGPLEGLETLALYRCLPPGRKADRLKATCLLPWLKSVKLTDDLASIDSFMRRVSFQAQRLEIDCDVQDASEVLAFGGVYLHRLDSSLLKNAKRLDIMLNLKKPSHMCFDTDVTASTTFQCFEIRYTVLPPKANPPNVLHSLLMTTERFSNVVTLDINVSYLERLHVDSLPCIYALHPTIHTIRAKNFASLMDEFKKPHHTPQFRALRNIEYSSADTRNTDGAASTVMLNQRPGFP